MAKSQSPLLLLLALVCAAVALPAVVSGSPYLRTGFIVKGRVFCDTCRAGFETTATTYIAGAKVDVKCRDRTTGELKYSADGVTDASGAYEIEVAGEHESEICETVLVSSPDASCASAVPGRDRARVVLSHNSGVSSDTRLANAVGFQKDTAMAGCAEVMKQYQLAGDEV